ncbi:MAG TPA: YihY/virulence factor BrkB family protein [Sphingomonadales bacterium]|mgnify:CR=1 FL=1
MAFLGDLGQTVASFSLVQTVLRFLKHDGPMVSGHLSYLTLLSLFPFFIFLVSLAGLVGHTEAGAHAILFLLESLPEELQEVMQSPVSGIIANSKSGIATLALVGAIWAASSALEAAQRATDRAFEDYTPPAFWLRRLQGIGLVLFAGIGILLGMSAFVLGPLVWSAVIYFVPPLEQWTEAAAIVRYLATAFLFFLAISALFFALKPRYRGRFVRVWRGALLTLFLWLMVGTGFSLYLRYFARYDVTYGSLAGAIVALIFFYLVNAGFLLGAELNAIYAERRHKAKTAALHPEQTP